MAGAGETPPPTEEGLPKEVCPSCGGPLTFESGRAEGHCAAEDIYMEVLRPTQAALVRPALVRANVLNATKRDLHELCRAYGLRVSGNKTDLLTRLLRYMDEHGIDIPPEELEEAGAASAPSAPSDAAAAFEPIAEPQPTPVEAEAEPSPEEAPHEEVDRFLEEVEVEAAVPEEPEATVEEEAVPASATRVAPAIDAERLRRDRRFFYAGALLAALGGPGLALASVAHDLFRVPIVGDEYEAFGPLNVMFAAFGAVVLIAGFVSMGIGLRGGVIRGETAGGA